MKESLRQFKLILFLNGLLALIFGISLFFLFYVFSLIKFETVIIYLAAYLMIEGLTEIYLGDVNKWLIRIVSGFINIILSLILLFWPIATIYGLSLVFAIWAIALGAMRLAESAVFRDKFEGLGCAKINGSLSMFFGVICLLFYPTEVVGLVFVMAFYLVLTGITMVFYAFKLDEARIKISGYMAWGNVYEYS